METVIKDLIIRKLISFAKLPNPHHGHLCRPAGGLRLGRLQPHSLYLLHHLDRRTALHRERPRDPHVFPAAGVLRHHPGGCRLAAAALCWDFYSHHHVEEPEVCKEIGLKVPRWATQHSGEHRSGSGFRRTTRCQQMRGGTVELKYPRHQPGPVMQPSFPACYGPKGSEISFLETPKYSLLYLSFWIR